MDREIAVPHLSGRRHDFPQPEANFFNVFGRKTRGEYQQGLREPADRHAESVNGRGVVGPQSATDLKRQLPEQSIDLFNGVLTRFRIPCHTWKFLDWGTGHYTSCRFGLRRDWPRI